MPCPGCFTPEKETWHPLCRRLDGPQGWSGWVWKISSSPGFNPWTVQAVASRYTEYAILAHKYLFIGSESLQETSLPNCAGFHVFVVFRDGLNSLISPVYYI
jgi:hypothetical protein